MTVSAFSTSRIATVVEAVDGTLSLTEQKTGFLEALIGTWTGKLNGGKTLTVGAGKTAGEIGFAFAAAKGDRMLDGRDGIPFVGRLMS